MSSSPAGSITSEESRPPLELPQLWCGPATPNEATVWMRGPEVAPSGENPSVPIEATLRGPYCEWARTLPATFRFEPQEPGVWKATVLDPVFWSPDFPARYRVQWTYAERKDAKVDSPDTPIARPLNGQRELAIRQWGVRGEHLWLNGNRWVFRAASGMNWTAEELAACHDQLLSFVVPEPNRQWLQPASLLGIAAGVRPPIDSPSALRDAVLHAAQWPAVMLLLLPATMAVSRESLRALAPNLLLVAEEASDVADDDTRPIPDWCDALLTHDRWQRIQTIREQAPKLPLMTRRILPGHAGSTEAARRACERLQRDLVERFDLSGYLVEYSGE